MRLFLVLIGFASVSAMTVSSARDRGEMNSAFESQVASAEYNRLSERLSRLAKKGHWGGADRIYRDLRALDSALSYRDLFIGAQVERRRGNVQAAYKCLRDAAKIEGTREVIDWLVALEEQYGPVSVTLERQADSRLVPEGPMFLPEHQKAIDYAQSLLLANRAFEGLLPVGGYTVGGQRIEVRANEVQQVQIPKAP